MRILIDMNPTPRWVAYLNGAGHETHHWSSIGAASGKDREICDYARANRLVLVTNDSEIAQGAIISLDWSGRPRARVLPLH